MITQKRLKELITYDESNGTFRWKTTRGKCKKGMIAGYNVYPKGGEYRRIEVDKISYASHRLAWLYVYGVFPSQYIDHIDGNGLNNAINNIRDVTHRENMLNQKLKSSNASGICGVYWNKSLKKWAAKITSNNKQIHLGVFYEFFEAICARKSAEYKHGFHQNHGRIT